MNYYDIIILGYVVNLIMYILNYLTIILFFSFTPTADTPKFLGLTSEVKAFGNKHKTKIQLYSFLTLVLPFARCIPTAKMYYFMFISDFNQIKFLQLVLLDGIKRYEST